MKLWLVDTEARTALQVLTTEPCRASQFLCLAHTERDALEAGRRRVLAQEALADLRARQPGSLAVAFQVVGDRIEARASDTREAAASARWLADELNGWGWDAWREGAGGVLVFGRRRP
jgi:hypothetical protein